MVKAKEAKVISIKEVARRMEPTKWSGLKKAVTGRQLSDASDAADRKRAAARVVQTAKSWKADCRLLAEICQKDQAAIGQLWMRTEETIAQFEAVSTMASKVEDLEDVGEMGRQP